MATILEQIVADKRRELAEARQCVPASELELRLADAPPPRDFLAALRDPPGVRIIAEVKRASPSAGAIRQTADAAATARAYESHGAACISVLTDQVHFKGHLNDLRAVRAAVALPVLRKDFTIDAYQLLEARIAGADAVLLIAEILSDGELRELRERAERLGMTALVEFYEPMNLPRVLDSGATLIGINNRDLRTFETGLDRTLMLAPLVPKDRLVVSESGIRTRGDVARVRAAGARAVLVGESLMRADDLAAAFAELRAE
jgi:indole-3-glycerol phosphate synthase